jgi:hypothetical protein
MPKMVLSQNLPSLPAALRHQNHMMGDVGIHIGCQIYLLQSKMNHSVTVHCMLVTVLCRSCVVT